MKHAKAFWQKGKKEVENRKQKVQEPTQLSIIAIVILT
jgi:hypothetical protein